MATPKVAHYVEGGIEIDGVVHPVPSFARAATFPQDLYRFLTLHGVTRVESPDGQDTATVEEFCDEAALEMLRMGMN